METLKINNEETNSKEKLIEIQNKIYTIEAEIKRLASGKEKIGLIEKIKITARSRIKKLEKEKQKMEEAEKRLSAKIIKNNIGSMEMKTNKPNQVGWIDNKSKEGKRNEKIDIEKEKIFEINQRTAEKELEERKRAIEGFEKSRTKEEKLTEIKEESGDSKIEGPFIHLNQATRERKYYDKEGKLIEKKEEELKKEIEKEPVDIPEQKKDEEIEEQTESVGEETPKKTTSEKEQEEEIRELEEETSKVKKIMEDIFGSQAEFKKDKKGEWEKQNAKEVKFEEISKETVSEQEKEKLPKEKKVSQTPEEIKKDIDIKNQELYNKNTMSHQENNPSTNIKPENTEKPPIINNDYTGILASENQNFFSKMSENAKSLANEAYEGLYKIPGVNRIVGKLEIGYNQFWSDKHEKKALNLKNEMNELDFQMKAKKYKEEKINSAIKNLEARGSFGGNLQLKLQKLNEEKLILENKKDKTQSKFESRDNNIKLYINKRDAIADKLINRYEEKLKPMEKELEELQTLKDQAELSATVAEVKHKEQIEKLKEEEEEKLKIEEELREGGLSKEEIEEATREIENSITEGYLIIEKEKLEFAQEKEKLNKKIAKVDKKANPYRDKREEFNRIKQKRPLNIEVETRKRAENIHHEEEIKAHTRKNAPENTYAESSSTTSNQTLTESSFDFETPPVFETPEEKIIKLEIPSYINSWNNYLKIYGKDDFNVFIDGNDFLKKTGFSKNKTLEFSDFKNILKKYYKVKKLPTDKINKFDKKIDEYFKKILETN